MASSGQQIPFSKEVKQAHIRNPRLIEDALRSISQDQVEEEQTLDYITDLEMRRDLLREIQAFQKANYHLPPINCAAFAILMVAPIRHLRTIWDNLKTGPDPQGRMQAWVQDLLRSPDAIRDFVVRGGRTPGGAQHGPTGAGGRSAAAAKKCKDRDNNRCIFSGAPDPEAAHIFPHATLEKRKFENIQRLLTIFWGSQEAQRWSQAYESRNIAESAHNLLSLTPTLHKWFDDAKMAIKPLRQTNNSIVLQIHWMKETTFKPSDSLPRRSIDQILEQEGLWDRPSWGSRRFFRPSGLPLMTGQTFTITSDNSDLPDFDLLELSWNLLRVGALCGAAEERDEGDEEQFPGGDAAEVAGEQWGESSEMEGGDEPWDDAGTSFTRSR